MKKAKLGWLRVAVPGAVVFQLNGCNPLSDAQLTQILTSFVSTALNSAVTNLIGLLVSGGTTAA